ncbi:hypothetical protein KSF78_0003198 [Schistosoma japonicum]|nr:hypothetical protein KSF78_0003198 [Schistosoma japonicum]
MVGNDDNDIQSNTAFRNEMFVLKYLEHEFQRDVKYLHIKPTVYNARNIDGRVLDDIREVLILVERASRSSMFITLASTYLSADTTPKEIGEASRRHEEAEKYNCGRKVKKRLTKSTAASRTAVELSNKHKRTMLEISKMGLDEITDLYVQSRYMYINLGSSSITEERQCNALDRIGTDDSPAN